ncbi:MULTISPECIES: GntR family transcriptional regulator [unclassified Streptomyces]|uniref:FadR/GntR family transcriptional regulator n=1 Tax=unclassified Streptomyces TaxID=2593676 RepID=UPI002E8215A8|nr:GntR family transcriptional regulator [Streptomyces sp. NBC_00589]WTI41361.1 GntR family transcriptional regulator [Streptomyces sp. NBC_00775]WUB24955.1 GntR family transcriptional regulator [Streptomyces sp. NBC_00589]
MERTGSEHTKIGQMRMAELVAAALRDRILAGGIGDGSTLPKQDELVAEFGVSYPSVREALRILETEGFITVRRGNRGGATVHAPDIGTAGYALGLTLQAMQVGVPDLGAALATLEPLCAAHCAERSDRERVVVPRLRELLAASDNCIDDGAAFTRASREFHDAVVGFDPNATLRVVVKSLTSLWSVQEEAWADAQMSRGAYPSRTERTAAQRAHERLVTSIEQGDADEAARIAEEHLTATQRVVCRTLKNRVIDAASAQSRARFRRG